MEILRFELAVELVDESLDGRSLKLQSEVSDRDRHEVRDVSCDFLESHQNLRGSSYKKWTEAGAGCLRLLRQIAF